MSEPKAADLRKAAAALRKSDRKFVSLDDLSAMIGIYPDVLGAELSGFEPMILLDPSINAKKLLEPIELHLRRLEGLQPKKAKRASVSSAELARYPTIASFVYARLTTAGGLVDPSAKLSDRDLSILRKLVAREEKKRRDARKKKAAETAK